MKRVAVAAACVGLVLTSSAVALAQPDTTVVNPPPVPMPTELTPPPLTVTLPPPPPPVTTTITAPPPPPVTTTVTPPPVTTTVTTTVTVTPPPPTCGAPITITTGGTYSGCYQSTNVNTPAVRISTTQPVTLNRARIIAKGNGVLSTMDGTQVTIRDSVFEQQDPGGLFDHRAVQLNRAANFTFEFNRLTDTDGVWLPGHTGGVGQHQMSSVTIRNNVATNIGRYLHPLNTSGCCVAAFQLSEIVTPAGSIQWNKVTNVAGQSAVGDVINLWRSSGTDTTHRIDVGNNLVDGAYPRVGGGAGDGTGYAGGGINLGDDGGGHKFGHDNVVVSTTNYGVIVASGATSDDVYAVNNLLVNDGAEQASEFGQAVQVWPSATPPPPPLHATGTRYNWKRSTTDPAQYPCYIATNCSGTQVSTTEQQARDEWEARRAGANVIVGPRP